MAIALLESVEFYADEFIEYLIFMWESGCEAHCYQMQSGPGREGGRAGPGPSLVSCHNPGLWLAADPGLTWYLARCRSQPLSLNVTLSALSLSSLHSRLLARPIPGHHPISNIQKIEQSFHIVKGLNGYESFHYQYTMHKIPRSVRAGQWQSDLNSERGSGSLY